MTTNLQVLFSLLVFHFDIRLSKYKDINFCDVAFQVGFERHGLKKRRKKKRKQS